MPLADRQIGLTTTASTALENSHVLITPTSSGLPGPFVIDNMTIFNFDTATGYMILFFDATAVPANGTGQTPIYWAFLPVATATVPTFVGVDWTTVAIKGYKGLVVAGSSVLTTPFTLTVATNSKLAFNAQVVMQ